MSLKNFSKAQIIGSTNLKVSNLVDHATSEPPTMSATIGRYLSTLEEGTRVQLRQTFDVCYAMAKDSVPFAKYPALLALEARHGVD